MEQSTVEYIKLFGKKFNIVSETDQRDCNNTLYLFADSKGWRKYVRDGDTSDNISELTYLFRDDGLYEDDEYFNGTTEDLIDAVAESMAKALDASDY